MSLKEFATLVNLLFWLDFSFEGLICCRRNFEVKRLHYVYTYSASECSTY